MMGGGGRLQIKGLSMQNSMVKFIKDVNKP